MATSNFTTGVLYAHGPGGWHQLIQQSLFSLITTGKGMFSEF